MHGSRNDHMCMFCDPIASRLLILIHLVRFVIRGSRKKIKKEMYFWWSDFWMFNNPCVFLVIRRYLIHGSGKFRDPRITKRTRPDICYDFNIWLTLKNRNLFYMLNNREKIKMHTEFIHCFFIYSRKTPQKNKKSPQYLKYTKTKIHKGKNPQRNTIPKSTV